MNRISTFSKTLIYVCLIIIGIVSFIYTEDLYQALVFAAIVFGVIVLIWLLFFISKKLRKEKIQRIIDANQLISARILAVSYFKNELVLQLLLENSLKNQISSLAITNPNERERGIYTKNAIIEVFVNPKKQSEIFLPGSIERHASRGGLDWIGIIVVVVNVFGIGIPIFLSNFERYEKEFQDIALLKELNGNAYMWELYFKPPKEINIKIYNPKNGEKIATIKDKNETALESNSFFLSKQNKNMVVVGTGFTPVFNIYNTSNYEKISDIKAFEQSNSLLQHGILKIETVINSNKFNKEDIIGITTGDGFNYFYSITNNQFYQNQNELKTYLYKSDSTALSKHLCSFALSKTSENVWERSLYLIELTDKQETYEFLKLAGNNDIDVDYYFNNNYYNRKYCKLTPLQKQQDFIEAKILYHDFDLVLLQGLESTNTNAKEKMWCVDKAGKVLFELHRDEYPDTESMADDRFLPLNRTNEIKVKHQSNFMFIVFNKYGAICVYLKTGKLQWKYEL